MTRGGARPGSGPAPIEGVKRSETLRARVTPDEKAACVRLVDDSGYETESDWLRSLIRREITQAAIDGVALGPVHVYQQSPTSGIGQCTVCGSDDVSDGNHATVALKPAVRSASR